MPTLTVLTTLGNENHWKTEMFIIETVSGTTTRWRSLATSVCFSPAVRRETPPAPHVIQLQYPAVIRWNQPQQQPLPLPLQQPPHQPLPLPQHLLLLPVHTDWLIMFHFLLTVQFWAGKWINWRNLLFSNYQARESWISGILIVGGYNPTYLSSAEVFIPGVSCCCTVGDMPEPRSSPSQCHGLVCGGVDGNDRSRYIYVIVKYIILQTLIMSNQIYIS